MWKLPLSQCKETQLNKKPEKLQESLYNTTGTKGSPRILSKNISHCPSMHMWKKCLWNNCSLQNISTQKSWNYLSTQQRGVCICCRPLSWLVGNLRATLPPLLLNMGSREKTESWPFCSVLAFQRAVHQLQSFKKKKKTTHQPKNHHKNPTNHKAAHQEPNPAIPTKRLLPVHGMEDCFLLTKAAP